MISWEVITLIIGFALGYLFYSKFNYRGGGVLVVPFLVIYLIKFPLMLPFLIIISFINLFILNFLYSKYLIYGRRLLYLSLIIGIVGLLIAGLFVPVNDWYPLLIPGLFAYNMHRELNNPITISKSVMISIIYFAVVFITALASYYLI
jgi:hypothetical protein